MRELKGKITGVVPHGWHKLPSGQAVNLFSGNYGRDFHLIHFHKVGRKNFLLSDGVVAKSEKYVSSQRVREFNSAQLNAMKG